MLYHRYYSYIFISTLEKGKIVKQKILIIGLLTMNLFAKPITWFEIQETPNIYRFAIIPKQPILIGFKGEDGKAGKTILLSKSKNSKLYKEVKEKIEMLISKHKLMTLESHNSKDVFAKNLMAERGLHIRFAQDDGKRWVTMFEENKIPKSIKTFMTDSKVLAREIMELSSEEVDGKKALEALKEKEILKVKIFITGKIFINNKESTMEELNLKLDGLKDKNGLVWYYRESPEKKVSKSTGKIIDSVTQSIISRGLPVKLVEDE